MPFADDDNAIGRSGVLGVPTSLFWFADTTHFFHQKDFFNNFQKCLIWKSAEEFNPAEVLDWKARRLGCSQSLNYRDLFSTFKLSSDWILIFSNQIYSFASYWSWCCNIHRSCFKLNLNWFRLFSKLPAGDVRQGLASGKTLWVPFIYSLENLTPVLIWKESICISFLGCLTIFTLSYFVQAFVCPLLCFHHCVILKEEHVGILEVGWHWLAFFPSFTHCCHDLTLIESDTHSESLQKNLHVKQMANFLFYTFLQILQTSVLHIFLANRSSDSCISCDLLPSARPLIRESLYTQGFGMMTMAATMIMMLTNDNVDEYDDGDDVYWK